MRKITVISALVACTLMGVSDAYAADDYHRAQGKPQVCPMSQSVQVAGINR